MLRNGYQRQAAINVVHSSANGWMMTNCHAADARGYAKHQCSTGSSHQSVRWQHKSYGISTKACCHQTGNLTCAAAHSPGEASDYMSHVILCGFCWLLAMLMYEPPVSVCWLSAGTETEDPSNECGSGGFKPIQQTHGPPTHGDCQQLRDHQAEDSCNCRHRWCWQRCS